MILMVSEVQQESACPMEIPTIYSEVLKKGVFNKNASYFV